MAQTAEHDGAQSSLGTVDLQSILVTLRKYRLGIAITTAIVTLLTMAVVHNLTPIYRATATLLISPPNEQSIISIEELVAQDLVSNDYFQTQVEVLRSRKLARRVVQSLSLTEHWEYNAGLERPVGFASGIVDSDFVQRVKADLSARFPALLDQASVPPSPEQMEESAIDKLQSNVVIRPLKDTNLVRVVVRGVDAALAKQIADGFGKSFISSYLDTKLELNTRASEWLDAKLVGMKQKLEDSEAQLLEYKERYGLVDLGGRVSGINERQIGVLTERLLEAKRERREARLQLSEIEDASARAGTGGEVSLTLVNSDGSRSLFSEYESLAVISSDPLVNRHRLALLEEERELEELRNRYGEKHPRVVDARSNRDIAASNLNRQINNVIGSVRKGVLLADANVRSIESEIQREKSEVHTVGRKEIQMVELEREVEANRDLYLKFYNRAREAAEAEGMGVANASINDPASVSSDPIFPRKRLLSIAGFLLSLFAASIIALYVERRRDTVQGVSDLARRIGLPVLGIVPVLSGRRTKGGKSKPVVPGSFKDKLGVFEESFQTVRSGLYLGHDDSRVILVTSSLPGEGKSTVAANLAHSMSFMERVVLVEADMRRPSISDAVGAGELGLSNYLAGECKSEDIQERVVGGMYFIPAGGEPYDSLELLSSSRFERLIANLAHEYDRVIIDSAPVGAVSDAMVIGKNADVAVFVVKADSTQVEDVEISLSRLQGVGVNVAGAVISQVDMNKVVSYGGHYRYRGYYDMYGYGRRATRRGAGYNRPAKQWQVTQ